MAWSNRFLLNNPVGQDVMVIGSAGPRYHHVPRSKVVRNRGTPVKQRYTAKLIARVNLIISIPRVPLPCSLATLLRTSDREVLGNDYADGTSVSVTFAFLSASEN